MVNKSKKIDVNEMINPKFIVIKPFSNLIYKKKDKNFPSSKNKLKKEENLKSKPCLLYTSPSPRD